MTVSRATMKEQLFTGLNDMQRQFQEHEAQIEELPPAEQIVAFQNSGLRELDDGLKQLEELRKFAFKNLQDKMPDLSIKDHNFIMNKLTSATECRNRIYVNLNTATDALDVIEDVFEATQLQSRSESVCQPLQTRLTALLSTSNINTGNRNALIDVSNQLTALRVVSPTPVRSQPASQHHMEPRSSGLAHRGRGSETRPRGELEILNDLLEKYKDIKSQFRELAHVENFQKVLDFYMWAKGRCDANSSSNESKAKATSFMNEVESTLKRIIEAQKQAESQSGHAAPSSLHNLKAVLEGIIAKLGNDAFEKIEAAERCLGTADRENLFKAVGHVLSNEKPPQHLSQTMLNNPIVRWEARYSQLLEAVKSVLPACSPLITGQAQIMEELFNAATNCGPGQRQPFDSRNPIDSFRDNTPLELSGFGLLNLNDCDTVSRSVDIRRQPVTPQRQASAPQPSLPSNEQPRRPWNAHNLPTSPQEQSLPLPQEFAGMSKLEIIKATQTIFPSMLGMMRPETRCAWERSIVMLALDALEEVVAQNDFESICEINTLLKNTIEDPSNSLPGGIAIIAQLGHLLEKFDEKTTLEGIKDIRTTLKQRWGLSTRK